MGFELNAQSELWGEVSLSFSTGYIVPVLVSTVAVVAMVLDYLEPIYELKVRRYREAMGQALSEVLSSESETAQRASKLELQSEPRKRSASQPSKAARLVSIALVLLGSLLIVSSVLAATIEVVRAVAFESPDPGTVRAEYSRTATTNESEGPRPVAAGGAKTKEKKSGEKSIDDIRDAADEGEPQRPPVAEDEEAEESIDEIRDDVEGEPQRPPVAEDEKAEKPDKQRLGASDVRRAMERIVGQARACGERTGFDGRVTMKFVVEPSTGRVSSVNAVSGSPTRAADKCLRSAIRAAKFPTFEPPAMSFRYPFLL